MPVVVSSREDGRVTDKVAYLQELLGLTCGGEEALGATGTGVKLACTTPTPQTSNILLDATNISLGDTPARGAATAGLDAKALKLSEESPVRARVT